MSRYYARNFKRNNNAYWDAPKNVYKVTTDQADFLVTMRYMNYKTTIARLKEAGYTNINICCLGKDMTFLGYDGTGAIEI